MSQIEDFEQRCGALGVKPVEVLRRAGLNRATWFRWKRGLGPTLRSWEAATGALAEIKGNGGSKRSAA